MRDFKFLACCRWRLHVLYRKLVERVLKLLKSDRLWRRAYEMQRAFISSVTTSEILLTFIGPYIMIYFCTKTNQMHQFLKFILFYSSTLHVLDGLSVHHQEFKTVHNSIRYTSDSFCWLLASGNEMELQFHLVPAVLVTWCCTRVCTVLDSWWWTDRPSETCRVLLQNKINLKKKTGVYRRLYYRKRRLKFEPTCSVVQRNSIRRGF
jgi:hypothetical protein